MAIFLAKYYTRGLDRKGLLSTGMHRPLTGPVAAFLFFTFFCFFSLQLFAQVSADSDKEPLSFDLVNVSTGGQSSGAIAIGHFDLGQTTDMVSWGLGGLTLLSGNGKGGFSDFLVSTGVFPQPPIVAGDFNGDGLSDLVIRGTDNVSAYVLINLGQGHFSPPVRLTSEADALYNFALGDINKDGALDIVATGCVSATNKQDLYIFLGDGSGNFSRGSPVGAGCIDDATPVIADFNRDGKLDLACINSQVFRPLAVLLGDGAGGFSSPTLFPTEGPHFYSYLVAADFNRDGNIDVALADGSGNIDVLLGDGLGKFSQAGTFKAGDRTSGLQASDLDADGSIDLVAPDQLNSRVVVLLGTGSGGFQPPSFFAVNGTLTLAIADFDNDGANDIAVGTGSGIVQLID